MVSVEKDYKREGVISTQLVDIYNVSELGEDSDYRVFAEGHGQGCLFFLHHSARLNNSPTFSEKQLHRQKQRQQLLSEPQ